MNTWQLRLPDGKSLSGNNEILVEGIVVPGFTIGSFDSRPGSFFTIPSCPAGDYEDVSSLPPVYPVPDGSTTRGEHGRNVKKAAEAHVRDNGKTVISRVIETTPVSDISAVYDRLCSLYPDACVFRFSTQPTGMWVGASPEVLLEADGKVLRTMALAGTRPVDTEGPWNDKNLHEQAIVTDFIVSTLEKLSLSPEAGQLQTRRAGTIEHLHTPITAPLPEDWDTGKLHNLLAALNPTPALGGFPRDEAMERIARLESHERAYYGGFFGYVESPRTFRLNVNLRSALITPEHTYIFVGGGITAKSNPDDEWEETQRKAGTMTVALI